jgi:hypothetical protein
MLNILDVWIENKWDQRRWDLALTTEKPVDTYKQMVEESRSVENSPSIDSLPQAEKDWLRNTG